MKRCGSSAVAQGIGLFLMGAITLPAGGFSLWLVFVQPENRTETIWGIIGAILFFCGLCLLCPSGADTGSALCSVR